jgi:hypothetical protein
MLYAFFWVIPRLLKFIYQRFGTLCLFHLCWRVGTYPPMKMGQCVPKRWYINFRSRGITQKKAYNIQNTAKVWNQERVNDVREHPSECVTTGKFNGFINMNSFNIWCLYPSLRVAAQSKVLVYGSLAGIAGSNPDRERGCLSLASVVCSQVEVSVSGWSPAQKIPIVWCVWVWSSILNYRKLWLTRAV